MEEERIEKTVTEKQDQLKDIVDKIKDEGTLDYLVTFITLALDVWG